MTAVDDGEGAEEREGEVAGSVQDEADKEESLLDQGREGVASDAWLHMVADCVQIDVHDGLIKMALHDMRNLLSSGKTTLNGYRSKFELYELGLAHYQVYLFSDDFADSEGYTLPGMDTGGNNSWGRPTTGLFGGTEVSAQESHDHDDQMSVGMSVTSLTRHGHGRGAGSGSSRPPQGLSLTLADHALGLMTYFSDEYEERAVLDALDSPAIGMMYADRLTVYPPIRWRAFLACGQLIPAVIPRPLTLKIRRRGGPGKMLERKFVTFSNRW